MSLPDFTLSAGERLHLTAVLGRDGIQALDAVLAKLRAGEKSPRAGVVAVARTLHKHGIVDFSGWPGLQCRHSTAGAGHPGSRPRANYKSK